MSGKLSLTFLLVLRVAHTPFATELSNEMDFLRQKSSQVQLLEESKTVWIEDSISTGQAAIQKEAPSLSEEMNQYSNQSKRFKRIRKRSR